MLKVLYATNVLYEKSLNDHDTASEIKEIRLKSGKEGAGRKDFLQYCEFER